MQKLIQAGLMPQTQRHHSLKLSSKATLDALALVKEGQERKYQRMQSDEHPSCCIILRARQLTTDSSDRSN